MSTLTYAQALAIVEELIRTAPAFEERCEPSEDELRWLGKCQAVLGHIKATQEVIAFRIARGNIGGPFHSKSAVMAPLLNTYYALELHLPERANGGFIPSGDTWNGFAALVRLIQKASNHLLLIDRYMDVSLFTELLPHSDLGGGDVFCLTIKGQYHHSLLAAHAKWANDEIGKEKPVEVRLAPPSSLHDRIIIIDRQEVWLVSQSLKDIAKHSPASLTKADNDLAAAKIEHYFELWDQCGVPDSTNAAQ